MIDYFRKWTGRCWYRLWDMECNEIKPGHLLRLYHWPLLEPPLTSSYLWRAEKGKGRATMLVSVTTGQRLPMSRTMATLLVKVEEPAWLNPADYAEQLHWAELSDWGFHLTTYQGSRGLRLRVYRYGGEAVFRFTPAEVRRWKKDPAVGRALLTEALYSLLHPRLGRRLQEAGAPLSEKAREAFARQMRRKAKAHREQVEAEQRAQHLRKQGFFWRGVEQEAWPYLAIGAAVNGRLLPN